MKLIDAICATVVKEGELAICWLGQAGFCLKDAAGTLLMLDPYLTDCGRRMRGFKRLSPRLLDPADAAPQYYLTTHIHFDHFDYDAIPVVAERSPGTRFIGPASCMEELHKIGVGMERCIQLDRGGTYEDASVKLRAILADHGTMAPDAIGVLLEMGGHRLYFSGDTAFHEELFQQVAAYKPDVAFVSVNGQFGNMTGEEGARAAELCGAQYAVPCHIWTFMEHRGDPYTFCKALEKSESCKARCFSQGEIQMLKSSNELIEMKKEIIAYESYPLYAAGSH